MKTILTVEDDAVIALGQSRTLRRAGYSVMHALTGEKAIEIVKRQSSRIDLILMDIDLGKGIDGTDAAQAILAEHDIPVVFVSSHTKKEIVERTEKIVNFGYVVKNSGDEVLLASIKMAFRLHEAQTALRSSEERYSKVFHTSPDAININRLSDGRYLAVNDGFTKIMGYSSSEVIGKSSFSDDLGIWVDSADRRRLLEELRRNGEVSDLEAQFRGRDGSTRTGLMSAKTVTINGEQCILSVTTDISDRKNAEKALYASNATLKALVDTLPVAIIVLDGSNLVQVWNPAAERIFGWSSNEIIGKTYPLIPSDAKDGRVECVLDFPQGTRVVELETARQKKDGSLVEVTLSVALLSEVENIVPHRVAMMTDITNRKSSELQLRQLSRAVEQSASTIVITDVLGNIEYVNPKFSQSTGYTPEEAIGNNPRILKSGATPSAEYAQLWRTIKAGGEWRGEFHNKKKNGELYWESASISPIRNADGVITHFLAVKEDITERKQMELQIRQMHNMQSIGTLAGGIAHDFNNILGIILGHVSLLQKRTQDPLAFHHSIDAITKAIQRGAGLVRQILTFARKTEIHPEPVNVNEAIQDLSRMIHETFPKTIEIDLHLSDGIPLITMDHTQFHQALLNLCVNARDAMMTPRDNRPQGGKLMIRTGLIDGATLTKYDRAATSQPYVHISVSDEGSGMSEETRQRIFEPFFTTKKIGEGTGLGLSLVYGVVKSHNGIIEVETRLGEGSTFHMYFPLTESDSGPAGEPTESETQVTGGKEGVLIVEDEAALLALLEAAFSDRGYHVHSARDGVEAVNAYQKHKEDIALVVTDLGLPKYDGASVVSKLLTVNPSLRIVVASGFFEPDVKSRLVSAGVRGFLSKPYRMDEVLTLVRNVLDEP